MHKDGNIDRRYGTASRDIDLYAVNASSAFICLHYADMPHYFCYVSHWEANMVESTMLRGRAQLLKPLHSYRLN